MAGRTSKKPTAKGKPRSRSDTHAATSVLEQLKAHESAVVLKILLERHQTLREEAEQIATELVSSPSVDEVAEDVLAAVTLIGIDSVNARAGRTSWGYVDPTEAAWELLEEALEDVISDMKRRMALGLGNAAEAMCRGIGISSASSPNRAGNSKMWTMLAFAGCIWWVRRFFLGRSSSGARLGARRAHGRATS